MRLACSGMVTRATEIPTTARRVSVASYCRTDDDEAKYNLGHKGCKASFYRHFAPLRTTETLLSITSLHFTIFQHRKGNRNANTFSASIMAVISCFCTVSIKICPWLLVQFSYNTKMESFSQFTADMVIVTQATCLASCLKIWYVISPPN